MLLGGLWHGASWNFVIWGGLHGGLLAVERMRGKAALYGRLPGPAARRGDVRDRAGDLGLLPRARCPPKRCATSATWPGSGGPQAGAALLGGIVYQPYYLLTFLAAVGIVWTAPQTWDWAESLNPRKALAATALMLLSLAALTTQAYNPFIYFIF